MRTNIRDNRKVAQLFVTACVAVVTLGACGGGGGDESTTEASPPASAGTAPPATGAGTGGQAGQAGGGSRLLGACDLVTQAEAREALGQDVKAGQFDLLSLGEVGCRYEAARANEFASVTIHLTPTQTFLSAQNSVADPSRKGQGVSGVGDKAFAWGAGRTIDIYVRKGSDYFRVHVGDLNGTKVEAQKALATKAASRVDGRGQAYNAVWGVYTTEKKRLPEAARNPKGIDPCTLLLDADAQAAGAIGAGVRAASVTADSDDVCTFRTRQGSIEVALTSKLNYDSLRTRREGLEPVPGLGDDAFFQTGAVDDGLYVRKGDVHVRIDAGTNAAATTKALGPKVVARIP